MKKHLLFVLATMYTAVGTVNAQSVGIQAEIPFNFVVDNKMLPAGRYTISPTTLNGSTILLRSSDLKTAMFITPCACASAPVREESRLVFRVVGNRYFLWQIWTGGYDTGRELHLGRQSIEEATAGLPQSAVIVAQAVGAR